MFSNMCLGDIFFLGEVVWGESTGVVAVVDDSDNVVVEDDEGDTVVEDEGDVMDAPVGSTVSDHVITSSFRASSSSTFSSIGAKAVEIIDAGVGANDDSIVVVVVVVDGIFSTERLRRFDFDFWERDLMNRRTPGDPDDLRDCIASVGIGWYFFEKSSRALCTISFHNTTDFNRQ